MARESDPTLGYATDVGRGSAFNQDKLGFYRPDDPRLADMAGSIYVVADGMGSRDRGAALADTAIRTIVRGYYGAVREHGRADGLAVALAAADRVVRDELLREPDSQDAGVAVVAVVLRGDELIVGHVGDCRAYLVRNGQPYNLTESPSQPAHLGRGTPPRPSVTDGVPIGVGDRVLLCSDGLYQLVEDAQLGSIVGGHGAQEASERLIAMANARGGWDNITSLVLAPFASAVRPAVPAEPPGEIPWRGVAVAAGAIIAIAALVLFRPWQGIGARLDALAQASAARGPGAPSEAAAPTLAMATTGPTFIPSATPTGIPSPTVPAAVPVPDLVGSAVSDAEQFARANSIGLDQTSDYSSTTARGFIVSQRPAPGTAMEPGETLAVTVSIGPAPPPTAAPPTATATATVAEPTMTLVPTQAPSDPDPPRDDPTDAPPPPEDTKEPPPTPKPAPPPDADGSEPPLARRGPGLHAPLRMPDEVPVRRRGSRQALGAGPRQESATPTGTSTMQTPTATATDDGSATPTFDPSETPTDEPTETPTDGPTETASATIDLTVSPTTELTATPTISGTGTMTFTATSTPTNTPTFTPTPTATNTPTDTPTPTPTPTFTPAPAYLPKLFLHEWFLCAPPWPGVDDPEPNDQRDVPRRSISLCPGMEYSGRLWNASGPPDTSDFFLIVPRRSGDIEIRLMVPPNPGVDYDLYVYEETGPELAPRGINPPGQDEHVVLSDLPTKAYYVRVVNTAFGEQISEPYVIRWSYR